MIERSMGYLKIRETAAPAAAVELERFGHAVLRDVFSSSELADLRREITAVFDDFPPDERAPRSPEGNQMFRYGMLNRSAACQRAVANRGILDVIEPLLGEDCHVIANTAWRNPPASNGLHGGDAWHIDAGPHVPLPAGVTWPADIPHPVFAIGVHIYLQECRLEDGPTGVIPGSHLSGRFPPRDQAKNDNLQYEGQGVVPLLAQPGDVGCFVSDIWHRRMPTLPGDTGRFFLQVHYGRRDIAQRIQTTADVNHLSTEAIARAASKRDKTVIGLHAPFFYDG
jgi:ectoine hydroxylase-related dioxygenase (phytanoyl-CoA dioxygenase family)